MPPHISNSCSGSGSEIGASQKHTVNRAVFLPKPEEGSLRHLLVTNPSKRWYIRPELWTSEILQQLECIFQPSCHISANDICSKDTASESVGPPITYEYFIGSPEYDPAASSLWMVDIPRPVDYTDRAIRRFFVDLVKLSDRQRRYRVEKNCSSKLPLLFGQNHVASVYCPHLVWGKDTGRCVCAFIDQTWMAANGKAYFPARRYKKKFRRHYAALLAQLKPVDPYFVAIIIAMAQISAPREPMWTTHSSVLISLFTPSEDRKSLILYTAEVTPAFLDKLTYPYKRSDSQLLISIEDIPLKSPARLLEAMTSILEQQGEVRRQQNPPCDHLKDNIKDTDKSSDLDRKRQRPSNLSHSSDSPDPPDSSESSDPSDNTDRRSQPPKRLCTHA